MKNQDIEYIAQWNLIVKALDSTGRIETVLESLRDMAHRNLLHYNLTLRSQATLDCTEEFVRTKKLPEEIRIDA